MVPSAAVATSNPAQPPRRPRALAGAIPAAILVLVASWQVGAIACAGSQIPSGQDWAQAAAYVREHRSDEELIVFAPSWIDPVGRLHLGDAIPIEMAARMDAARYPAIWELSARGARAPATRDLEPDSEIRFGGLRVRRYVQEPAEVVTDFLAAFSGAELHGAWARRPALALEEVGFSPRRCVRAVPRAGGKVTITFSDVELGERLVGYAGLADIFTLRDIREPGRLRIDVDGEQVASVNLGIDDGWVRFAAETAPRTGAEVVFVASAEVPERLICFAAEARR